MKELIEPRLLAVLEQSTHTGKWKAYEKYKDSGVEWLGEIPEHWYLERLKFNSYIKGRVGWQNLRSSEFTEEGPYLITGMHFEQGRVNWDACYHITKERYEMAPEIQVKVQDILLTKDGSIGKVCHIDYLPSEASLNSHLLVIRPLHQEYTSRYLYYLLLSDIFRAYIQLNQVGTTFFGISQENVVNFPCIFPSFSEQQAIVAFLDRETTRINELIAKKERMIELLQERRTAIINQAVTRGLNPDVPMKDSGVEWLGAIPAHWEARKLKYVATFFGGGTPSKANEAYWSGDIPWVSPKDMKSEIILDTEDHISTEALKQSTTNLIRPGAVFIVVRSGILRHSIPVAINHVPVTINQDIKAILPQKELLSQFLASFIHSQQRTLLIAWRKYGATVESIEYDLLVNTPIPIPPIKEQEAILGYIQQKVVPIDKLISVIQEGIKKLKEYNAALISAAVTGKIDVRGEIADVSVEEAAI